MIYRADVSEQNSTLRDSGFMILQRLNHLQRLSDEVRYGSVEKDVEIEGWSDVLLIEDLAIFFPQETQMYSIELHKTWQENFEQLKTEHANERMTEVIKAMRTQIKTRISRL